jgi:methyltransferase (TIGR00027 family)
LKGSSQILTCNHRKKPEAFPQFSAAVDVLSTASVQAVRSTLICQAHCLYYCDGFGYDSQKDTVWHSFIMSVLISAKFIYCMENTLINDVSDTALWIAAFRAIESERNDAAFKDTLAGKLAGEKGRKIVAATPHREAMSFAMVVRTAAIDRLVLMAIQNGVDTVINLGAGMDTRPYRMDLPGSLHWIEVDLPGIVAYKNHALAGHTPICRLQRIAFDLSDDPGRKRLFKELGGATKKALVITEGVIGYLTNDQAARLSAGIYNVPSFHYWIMDYSQGKMRTHRRARNLKKILKNAPLQFTEPNPLQFFRADGWSISEDLHILDEAGRIGRKFPLMFPWNLLLRFSRKIRAKANNTYGYVMFGK